MLYVPHLYVITSDKRTFLVCLITTFCPCMKSRGVLFLDLFCSAYSWLVGEPRGSCFVTSSPRPSSDGSTVLWKPAACVLCPSDLEQANRIWASQWTSVHGEVTLDQKTWCLYTNKNWKIKTACAKTNQTNKQKIKQMVSLSQQLITCNSSDWRVIIHPV